MKELAIYCRGIRKAYRTGSVSTQVLDGVDLEVKAGECVFLAGPSGSGKSTLLSILGCILSADAGEIRISGQQVSQFDRRSQARFRREVIGFVFQRFHLVDGLRAWENVEVAFDLLGCSKKVSRKLCYELLDAVGLQDKATNHISQLSMGQRQRVALARALAGNPSLILADEPTAALDAESGLNAMQLMRDLTKKQGKTAFVVTHDARIYHMADRILYLDSGRVVRTWCPSDAAKTSDHPPYQTMPAVLCQNATESTHAQL